MLEVMMEMCHCDRASLFRWTNVWQLTAEVYSQSTSMRILQSLLKLCTLLTEK